LVSSTICGDSAFFLPGAAAARYPLSAHRRQAACIARRWAIPGKAWCVFNYEIAQRRQRNPLDGDVMLEMS
jgi:hypothetical protein